MSTLQTGTEPAASTGSTPEPSPPPKRPKRVVATTVLQMEAVECGAAALGSVLGAYGRFVPLEELRVECGVSRDGSKASNMLKAARKYGMQAKGFKRELEGLYEMKMPVILFWNFNHFVVLEGFGKDFAYINDPASGPRKVTDEEFDHAFTGVVLTFEPGENFQQGGRRSRLLEGLYRRLSGSKTALSFAVIAGLMLVIPGLLAPAFLRHFIDEVLIAQRDSWLGPLIVGMALTVVVQVALNWFQQFCLLRLETKVVLTTSSRFFWHVLRLPMEFFNQRWPGEIATRVAINERVASLISGELATAIISLLSMFFYAAVMLFYDATLTVVGIGMAVINVIALRYVSQRRIDESQKLERARGQVAGAAAGGLMMMESLKSTGTESEFFQDWAGRYAKSMNAEQQLGVSTTMLNSIPTLLTGINRVLILALGGLHVIEGHLSVGMLLAFQSLMSSFMAPTNLLVNLAGQVQEMEAGMKRLDDVLRYPPDPLVASGTDGGGEPDEIVQLTGELEIRNVTFGYSRLEKPLIQEFSLTLKPGSRVALVGKSGSGKSTVAKLVAGLFDPWSGDILFDGKPREEVERSVLANSLAVVDQDIFLFGGSVRDNVTLWDSTITTQNIVGAARDAAIHDDIAVRKDGYEHILQEGGGNLSGGQRQRLEIARALAVNPTILVLDEATSALDANTEKLIDDHIRRRGCTCIIVAHRLSTIRDADEILIMEGGQVVQRGTHEELKDVEGPYARLIEN